MDENNASKKKSGGIEECTLHNSPLNFIFAFFIFHLHFWPAWQAQKWEGRWREKSAKVALPIPLSFSLPPYPLPLSMPATQATALLYLNACYRLQSYYHALPHLKGKKRTIKCVSQKFNQKFDDSLPLDSPCRHSVYWTVPLVSVLHGVHCPCTHNTHNVIKLTAVA